MLPGPVILSVRIGQQGKSMQAPWISGVSAFFTATPYLFPQKLIYSKKDKKGGRWNGHYSAEKEGRCPAGHQRGGKYPVLLGYLPPVGPGGMYALLLFGPGRGRLPDPGAALPLWGARGPQQRRLGRMGAGL